MTQMTNYKAYSIEPMETSPSRWHARIRRLDGRKIKILVDGREEPFIETVGMEHFSVDAAIASAKEMIDGGGMV